MLNILQVGNVTITLELLCFPHHDGWYQLKQRVKINTSWLFFYWNFMYLNFKCYPLSWIPSLPFSLLLLQWGCFSSHSLPSQHPGIPQLWGNEPSQDQGLLLLLMQTMPSSAIYVAGAMGPSMCPVIIPPIMGYGCPEGAGNFTAGPATHKTISPACILSHVSGMLEILYFVYLAHS